MDIGETRKTEGIIDRSWRSHLEHGQVLGRWQTGAYRAVMVRVTEQISVIYYHLRVLVFAGEPVPVLSANLESSMFEDARFLGVHTTDAHFNHGPAPPGMTPEAFRRWAGRVAEEYLGAAADGPSAPRQKNLLTGSPSETPPRS